MKTSKIIGWAAFALMVLAQWGVPWHMVWAREQVLLHGEEFAFKTAPVDPNDPFIGKYVQLAFDASSLNTPGDTSWQSGEWVYALLGKDSLGFARIETIQRQKPNHTDTFLHLRVSYAEASLTPSVFLEFPFDRFYLEEYKAPRAEAAYNKAQSDTTSQTYALVKVWKGDAVLTDVQIDGVSITTQVTQKERQ
jgi:uncharacterized membrane-anchored protein